MKATTTTRGGRGRLPVASAGQRLPLVLDLGPAGAYVVRRAARHIEGLDVGDVLAVDVGPRRVTVKRQAGGGWTLDDGAELPTLAAVLAELNRAAAAWLAEGGAAA